MKLLYTVLPLGAIELTLGNVMIIIGVLALFFLLIGGKMAFGFMRTMQRMSHHYGHMGHMMPPVMEGNYEPTERKSSGLFGAIIFAAILFLIWLFALQGPQEKQSVNYREDTSAIVRIVPPVSKKDKKVEVSKRVPEEKESRRNFFPKVPQSEGAQPKFYNTSPSKTQAKKENSSAKESVLEPLALTAPPEKSATEKQFTVQVACGSNPAFVRDEAGKIHRAFPKHKIQLYEDAETGCIKILVGQFFTENGATNFRDKIATRLKKEGHVIGLDSINERLLIPISE